MKTFKEWILKESQQSFLGRKDLQQQYNIYINKYVLRDLDNEITYVEIPEDQDQIEIYLKPTTISTSVVQKIIEAVKFYSGEIGVQLGQSYRSNDSLIIPIQKYPRYDYDFSRVKNPIVRKNLSSGNLIDVNDIGYEVENGVFKLNRFVKDANYFDSKNNKNIFSIGKSLSTGEIFASHDTRYYNNDDYDTLYLR
jgi:hypothetical protein